VNGDPVSALEPGKIAQQGSEFIDPDIQFLVSDMVNAFFFDRLLRN
jgi:hypothetical protein